MRVSLYTPVCMNSYVYAYVCLCLCYVCACVYVFMCVCLCLFVFVCLLLVVLPDWIFPSFTCWVHKQSIKITVPVHEKEGQRQRLVGTKETTFESVLQGVQEKLCFFTIHCSPSLAYIAIRDLQRFQRNASVQSLLLAGNFLYNQ